MSEWLTSQQAASYLQVHINTLWNYTVRKKLKAGHIGRVYRFRKEDLDSFVLMRGKR